MLTHGAIKVEIKIFVHIFKIFLPTRTQLSKADLQIKPLSNSKFREGKNPISVKSHTLLSGKFRFPNLLCVFYVSQGNRRNTSQTLDPCVSVTSQWLFKRISATKLRSIQGPITARCKTLRSEHVYRPEHKCWRLSIRMLPNPRINQSADR